MEQHIVKIGLSYGKYEEGDGGQSHFSSLSLVLFYWLEQSLMF